MPRRFLPAAAALALFGCYTVSSPHTAGLSSFDVKVAGIFLPGTSTPIDVVTSCVKRYGTQAAVPADQRGTKECRYAMPRAEVQVHLTATALGSDGTLLGDFAGPVSFRSVPGDLTGGYEMRWAQASQGKVEMKLLKVAHLYGEVRFWAEDAPPQAIYFDGGQVMDPKVMPVEPERTFATGLSPVIYFEDPTLAHVQIPDGADNRSSPLVGQFLTVGKEPESGSSLIQSCTDDTVNDGKPATMVVTGVDPSGFFVTDLTACRLRENAASVKTPEPNGYMPGTFAGMFVYNYSFPEGLNPGDRLFTLSGSVQEFTSTTQLTFPSWSIAEKVRELPPDQWDKWLKYAKPYEINLRTCGLEDRPAPFVTDALCGYPTQNLKMESLESMLVKVSHVRFPEILSNCDFNADTSVPFFCQSKFDGTGCATACDGLTPWCNPTLKKCVADQWGWAACGNNAEPANEAAERACLINCVTGQGEWQGKRCSEKSTFTNFGQFVVEMSGPGPAEAGFDAVLPARMQQVALTAASARIATGYRSGTQVRIWCNADARMKVGDASVAASSTDTPLAKETLVEHTFAGNESHVAFIADGAVVAGNKCVVSENTHTRINLTTKDAVPDLQPDCREDDPDLDRAEQCRYLRAARYDVVGHLRQVQPARPRWMVMPRDADDLCCYPGPGMPCPRPLKVCP
ncbi:MAG: single stranded DNA-binding domain-containing protein [Myxococcaceae bacterium]